MKSIAFHNLGCKVNEYEMEVMRQIVQKNNYKIVEFTQKADVYVVNTCTVTNMADRKSRQMLHRAKQLNPNAVVVAAGCYAQTGIEDLKRDLSVDIIIGNNHKTEIADILNRYFAEHPGRAGADTDDRMDTDAFDKADGAGANIISAENSITSGTSEREVPEQLTVMSELSEPTEYENTTYYESSDRTRVDVKIQDGCNQFCAYCAIPLARGRVRSRRPSDIIEEIARLVDNGHREIVLTGIHISSYGIDFDDEAWNHGEIKSSEHESLKNGEMMRDYRGKSKLFDLIEIIDREIPANKLSRIRLGSLEPRVVTEENVARLIAVDRVCPHFHMSLQSGCDSVLKRMNRHYTTEEYKNSVELLRDAYKAAGHRIAITTDVIVGFPGETEDEFADTVNFLEQLKLYEMHVFKYSRRKNTVADRMPGQVADKIKDERSDILLDMTSRHSQEYRKLAVGTILDVLFEEEKEGYYIGHTSDYIRVAVKADEDMKKDMEKTAQSISGVMENDIAVGVIGRIWAVRCEGLLRDDTVAGILTTG